MQAGKLDQTITFRSRTTTKSASGEDIEGSPTDVATVWARIRPVSGQRAEFFGGGDRFNVLTKYDVEIRYLTGLNEAMEIYWADRGITLDILSMPDVGKRPMNLKILAEERE